MKYSIIMPYYKRVGHLCDTLVSFDHHYKNRFDYEVVIAEDSKNADYMQEHQDLETLVSDFKDKINIKHFVCVTKASNPAPFFNEAADKAEGKILIITNPEGFHKENILRGLDAEFERDMNVYVVCASRNVNGPLNIKRFEDFKPELGIWYQHSIHRNAHIHFCSAISKENYDKLGGFDNEFGGGISCEDIDWLERVKRSGFMHVKVRDDLLTYHIAHPTFNNCAPSNPLWQRNRAILARKGFVAPTK